MKNNARYVPSNWGNFYPPEERLYCFSGGGIVNRNPAILCPTMTVVAKPYNWCRYESSVEGRQDISWRKAPKRIFLVWKRGCRTEAIHHKPHPKTPLGDISDQSLKVIEYYVWGTPGNYYWSQIRGTKMR